MPTRPLRLLALATFLCVACAPESDACVRDETCASGLRCGADCLSPAARDGGSGLCSADSDCDDGVFCNGSERCAPSDASADARGCLSAAPRCAEGERCDEAERRCVVECADADGDGARDAACGGDDCDDADALRFPGNVEICDVDDRDEDCDPSTFGVRDLDADASPDAACCNVSAAGVRTCGTDCDDARPDVSRTSPELCDGIDNDCDGTIDERVSVVDWYLDTDGDLFGDASDSAPIASCAPQPGRVSNARDCDDADATRNPAATEACDEIDNDCSGEVDEGVSLRFYRDADFDGFGSMLPADETFGCAAPDGFITRGGDCDDGDIHVFPGAPEICDRRYDDCRSPMAGALRPEEDPDDDGWAPMAPPCFGGPRPRGDCNETQASVNPGVRDYFERPYCPTGGSDVCLLSGIWYCGAPRPSDGRCVSVTGLTTEASWDYDCDGSDTRSPPFSALGCRCSLAASCAEAVSASSMLMRTEGPVYSAGASCGEAAGWSTCTGRCPSTCGTDTVPTGRRVPCR